MPLAKAQYLIFVDDRRIESGVMFTAPLKAGDRRYFVDGVLPTLRPLTDEEYMSGPAVILHTLAKFSYIVYRNALYWCVEWEPGLIVVRFSAVEKMAWTALRSPIPNFGGRTPTAEDLRDYKESSENHQYNLVFNAWDAQFDEDWRRWRCFKKADAKTAKTYHAALVHVHALEEQMEARYSAPARFDRWVERCKRNLEKWAGNGV